MTNNDLFLEDGKYYEESICIRCNGSGEGFYDDTKCRVCHGSGVEYIETKKYTTDQN